MLDDLGADIILRCPMIPGYNMTEEHKKGIMDVASKMNHLLEIHLEPYHNVGISKRIGLGMEEYTEMITPPAREELLVFADRIKLECGISAVVM